MAGSVRPILSLLLLFCCFGCMLWASDHLYRESYFLGGALLLLGWGLLLLGGIVW